MERVRLHRGDKAPEFALPDQDGNTVSPASLRGSKVVLYFYPAAGTPGCTTEACDFRDNLASLRSAGYSVVGISPDSPQRLREWAYQERLVYPLLSDEDHAVHRRYGAWGGKTVDGGTRMGPLRSTFVLDAEGVLEHALYDVKAQEHVAELRRLLGV